MGSIGGGCSGSGWACVSVVAAGVEISSEISNGSEESGLEEPFLSALLFRFFLAALDSETW